MPLFLINWIVAERDIGIVKLNEKNGRDRLGETAPSILQILAGLTYDVETIDIVAGHVAGLLVIDKGVEGLALVGPHQ